MTPLFLTDTEFAALLGIGHTKFEQDKAKGYYDTVERFQRTPKSRSVWVRKSVDEFIESRISTAA